MKYMMGLRGKRKGSYHVTTAGSSEVKSTSTVKSEEGEKREERRIAYRLVLLSGFVEGTSDRDVISANCF
jgi:hypothetical protein